MDKQLVLITGASSGIGRAIGEYLSEKGYTVFGTTRNLNTAPDISSFNLVELDVRQPHTIEAVVSRLIKEHGRIDILINNAGVGITGPLEETPVDEAKKSFDTNFFGPLEMIRFVLPHMRQRRRGFIVNITSIAGFMGLPFRGYYSAGKGALALAMESLRLETKGFNIRIANLAPGDFATNIAAGRYHSEAVENSDYAESYKRSLELMDEHVDSGGDPVEVARKVHQIISSPSPRVNYLVGGRMQRFSVVLKRLLPDKIYEKMLLNHYKL